VVRRRYPTEAPKLLPGGPKFAKHALSTRNPLLASRTLPHIWQAALRKVLHSSNIDPKLIRSIV